MKERPHYTVGELAERGGVSRRTVRYYVQEGLIPPPHGLGRGAHYDEEHLARLLEVKGLQEQSLSLTKIREVLRRPRARGRAADAPTETGRFLASRSLSWPAPGRPPSHWTRLELLPGIELQVQQGRELPDGRQLAELRDWFRRNMPTDERGGHR